MLSVLAPTSSSVKVHLSQEVTKRCVKQESVTTFAVNCIFVMLNIIFIHLQTFIECEISKILNEPLGWYYKIKLWHKLYVKVSIFKIDVMHLFKNCHVNCDLYLLKLMVYF